LDCDEDINLMGDVLCFLRNVHEIPLLSERVWHRTPENQTGSQSSYKLSPFHNPISKAQWLYSHACLSRSAALARATLGSKSTILNKQCSHTLITEIIQRKLKISQLSIDVQSNFALGSLAKTRLTIGSIAAITLIVPLRNRHSDNFLDWIDNIDKILPLLPVGVSDIQFSGEIVDVHSLTQHIVALPEIQVLLKKDPRARLCSFTLTTQTDSRVKHASWKEWLASAKVKHLELQYSYYAVIFRARRIKELISASSGAQELMLSIVPSDTEENHYEIKMDNIVSIIR
jgi:hypothetical protein